MGFARSGQYAPARLAAGVAACLLIAACDLLPSTSTPIKVPLKKPVAAASTKPAASSAPSTKGATPMAQRVATLGLLNKRNNLSEDITLKPGEARTIGPVIIRLAACERTAPWELPQETGAFVQVDIRERGAAEHARVFSGWLFRESPSLNVVEHPIYDVWVKDCAMRFPGEEGASGKAKDAKDAAPGGSPNRAAPAPTPTPEPTPAPAPPTTPAA